jgi:hypothetical protein
MIYAGIGSICLLRPPIEVKKRCRNINLPPIQYAFPVHLRRPAECSSAEGAVLKFLIPRGSNLLSV